MHNLFYLSVMVIAGLVFGRLVKLVRLPNVTGYIIAGLLIGPSVIGLLPENTIAQMSVISDVALGFIAFSIGGEFKWSYFRRVGLQPVIIAIFEALVAVAAVIIGLLAAGYEPAFSIVMGSIAAATAPAATIMVIKQYQAKGPVTETLLCVVALDDAVALIGFGFAVTAAKVLNAAGGNLAMSIIKPFLEVFGSLAIGAAFGALFALPLRWFKKDGNRLCITIAFLFMAIALSDLLGISALLTCMAMGCALANVTKSSNSIMNICDQITPPIFMLFFVLSGADLKLSVIPSIGLVGIIYVILRVVGKMAGAWFGGVLSKAPRTVRRYLGAALIPQAGVAIGLSLVAESVVPAYAQTIRAVVLCGTLIYEIIGPVAAKITLTKAGEIVQIKQPAAADPSAGK